MKKIAVIENRFEADLLSDALAHEGIEHVIRSFQDSAYDGLYVTQKGYAQLLTDEKDKEAALAILDDIRKSVSDEE